MTAPRTARPLRWAAAAAVLALDLAGCSSDDNDSSAPEHTQTPSHSSSPTASSAAPTSAAPTTARPTTAAPTRASASATTAAPSPKSTTAAAAPKDDAANSTAIAAPGTKCGPTARSSAFSVYVFGGQVSCSEATRVMNEYQSHQAGDEDSNHGHIAIGAYDCTWDNGMRGVEARNSLCINKKTGAYIDSYPSSMRIVPGHEAEPADYQRTGTTTDYQGRWLTFTTPDHKVGCGIGEDGTLNCWRIGAVDPGGDGARFDRVTMKGGGAPSVRSVVRQDLPYELFDGGDDVSHPLDQGTTINAMKYSCQAVSADAMKCLSPQYGFTISSQGVTKN